jgi:serine/threonine-protein kinase RsbW
MEQPETFYLKLPARYRYLKLIGEAIELLFAELQDQQHGQHQGQPQQDQIIYGITLAVHEVANNVIEHAYGHEQGTLEVTLQFEPLSNRFTAHLHDVGAIFDPSPVITPNLDTPQESGYGLFLAEQLMDEVTYLRQADGNHWQLVKHLEIG